MLLWFLLVLYTDKGECGSSEPFAVLPSGEVDHFRIRLQSLEEDAELRLMFSIHLHQSFQLSQVVPSIDRVAGHAGLLARSHRSVSFLVSSVAHVGPLPYLLVQIFLFLQATPLPPWSLVTTCQPSARTKLFQHHRAVKVWISNQLTLDPGEGKERGSRLAQQA